MLWLLFSLLSALSESLKDTFGKLSSEKSDEYTAALSLHLFSLIFIVPMLIYSGIPKITTSFWVGSAAFLIITPLWTILYMKALRMSELSKIIPLMAFNPLFTALLAIVFGQSIPSLTGWLGIILIVVGIYVINVTSQMSRRDFFLPIKNILADPGARAMLVVALSWSFGAHFSKMRVDGSSPVFSTFSGAIIGIVTTYFLAYVRKKPVHPKVIFQHKWKLMPIGVFYFLATVLSSFALQFGSATYVFATKRSSIVASLISGKFVFQEQMNWFKVVGAGLMMGGIVMLAVG